MLQIGQTPREVPEGSVPASVNTALKPPNMHTNAVFLGPNSGGTEMGIFPTCMYKYILLRLDGDGLSEAIDSVIII